MHVRRDAGTEREVESVCVCVCMLKKYFIILSHRRHYWVWCRKSTVGTERPIYLFITNEWASRHADDPCHAIYGDRLNGTMHNGLLRAKWINGIPCRPAEWRTIRERTREKMSFEQLVRHRAIARNNNKCTFSIFISAPCTLRVVGIWRMRAAYRKKKNNNKCNKLPTLGFANGNFLGR